MMVILPTGYSQFMSGALTWTINGKEDPLWEDLKLSGLERDIPRGADTVGRGDCSWEANW